MLGRRLLAAAVVVAASVLTPSARADFGLQLTTTVAHVGGIIRGRSNGSRMLVYLLPVSQPYFTCIRGGVCGDRIRTEPPPRSPYTLLGRMPRIHGLYEPALFRFRVPRVQPGLYRVVLWCRPCGGTLIVAGNAFEGQKLRILQADHPPKAAFAPVRLHVLPARALNQCRLDRRLRLCPRRLPRASIAYRRGAPLPTLVAERFAPGRNGGALEIGISFAYGVPWEPSSGPDWRQHAWRNRPCCFLHFDLWHALRGIPTFPDTARRATLSGRKGDLAPAAGAGMACGAGNAGLYFCNHVRFRWKQGGSWFVATLHSFGNRETTALLGRIIRELRPIA
jgi:hypothetical protein